eukprot:TRINITY_DN395_c0_g1_i2.p4 TRINITY_DN395_c0_g1~~TRINITY_DN395_c0_g1_i2.p4  ORF type:complete len:125 (-),score=15.87 TRINITY_DN395_c0_g1_i2:773-1147(-)
MNVRLWMGRRLQTKSRLNLRKRLNMELKVRHLSNMMSIHTKQSDSSKQNDEDLQLRHPSLAILMVGSHYNSEIYIKKKRQLAKKIGVSCEVINFEEQVLEGQLLETIDGLNRNDHVDGIILQVK